MKFLITKEEQATRAKHNTRGYCTVLSYMIWGKFIASMYWC